MNQASALKPPEQLQGLKGRGKGSPAPFASVLCHSPKGVAVPGEAFVIQPAKTKTCLLLWVSRGGLGSSAGLLGVGVLSTCASDRTVFSGGKLSLNDHQSVYVFSSCKQMD
ncbi:hypothetical protein DV515_00014051 [Chloebia gouldiae]|uniref:Uncharacterized protein n=1 Tax=Chloebia gouldiae TaxID=44316 RepID=A0A3L8RZ44_CHLGU|nr:hypothetical protein DV515_00014051 [Chloebia gouldiae]